MLNFLFRSRSPQRDRETDQARLARIHQTVRTCVTNAESELNGLRARLEKAQHSASMLVGNIDNNEHDEASRSELRSAEERLLATERRIVQLKDHIAALQRIANAVNLELNS
jgi:predicted  nucleic acid-binding Zn-ribbon protein